MRYRSTLSSSHLRRPGLDLVEAGWRYRLAARQFREAVLDHDFERQLWIALEKAARIGNSSPTTMSSGAVRRRGCREVLTPSGQFASVKDLLSIATPPDERQLPKGVST